MSVLDFIKKPTPTSNAYPSVSSAPTVVPQYPMPVTPVVQSGVPAQASNNQTVDPKSKRDNHMYHIILKIPTTLCTTKASYSTSSKSSTCSKTYCKAPNSP